MTREFVSERVGCGSRWPRLVAAARWRVRGVAVAHGHKVVGYFTSAVGLYPGDEVRVVGVPVGKIDSIEPRAERRQDHHDGAGRGEVTRRREGARHVAEPGVGKVRSARARLHRGPALADGATIGLDRTAVPVEWDEVKEQLTQLSQQLGPQQGAMQGPLSAFVNQAADTFDGNGDSFRQALRELSQTAGRLGDSRTDLFGTVKNLQMLVNALSKSNEQIVQFTGHVASVSQVLADSSVGLDDTLGSLNQALSGRPRIPQREQRGADRPGEQAGRLHQHPDRSQRRHRADPACPPERAGELLQHLQPGAGHRRRPADLPNFANPVQFICGATSTAGNARQLQASRNLPPANGSGAASASR